MQLIAVTNDQMSNEKLVDTLLKFEPFIDLVILREKSKTAIEVLDLIDQLTTLGFDCTKIIVHERADIASLTSVNKVQLPGHGLPLSSALHHFPSISFGKSIHSFDEAKEAYVNGAGWLLYGHLFQTASKIGLPHRGTEELFRITKSFPIPVYAIGGIHPQHLQLLHENGVAGVAIMSSIFGSDNVLESVKSYANMILLKNGGDLLKKTIDLNGNRYEMPSDTEDVQTLLSHLGLSERIVIVELNREILAKDLYDKPINDRDQIEIIHFVGGG